MCVAALVAVPAVPAVAATKDQTSAWDQQWPMTSISGGKIAEQMGQRAAVKGLGPRLV